MFIAFLPAENVCEDPQCIELGFMCSLIPNDCGDQSSLREFSICNDDLLQKHTLLLLSNTYYKRRSFIHRLLFLVTSKAISIIARIANIVSFIADCTRLYDARDSNFIYAIVPGNRASVQLHYGPYHNFPNAVV